MAVNAEKFILYGGIGLALAAVVYVVLRGFGGVAKDVTRAATDVVIGGASGVVVGVGEAVGIPETNDNACSLALREGRTLDASFLCPAGRWIREGVFGGGVSGVPQLIPENNNENPYQFFVAP